MERAYQQQGSSKNATVASPNVMTYTSYLGGLARSKERDLARRADAVLSRMEAHGVEADMVAYTSVLNCWSKAVSRREREVSAQRSLRIIEEMERLYAKGVYAVKPSLITYATAIRAIGNSLDPEAPNTAEALLRKMYERYEAGLASNMKPSTTIYNAVLIALSRATGHNRAKNARRAESLLQEMMDRVDRGEADVEPDVRSWAAVLRAWAMSGTYDAAENAERVLSRLEDYYAKGQSTFGPNFVCYTTVMGAWGQSTRKDALDRLEVILKKLEVQYEETQDADIRPNTVSYVTAIDAFIRRNERDAALRAQATVDRMTRLYAKGLGMLTPLLMLT
jgi:hypothetical protein